MLWDIWCEQVIANFLTSQPVKELRKSSDIWRSYRKSKKGDVFFETQCICLLCESYQSTQKLYNRKKQRISPNKSILSMATLSAILLFPNIFMHSAAKAAAVILQWSFCLFVHTHLRHQVSKLHWIFCACYPWPWLWHCCDTLCAVLLILRMKSYCMQICAAVVVELIEN